MGRVTASGRELLLSHSAEQPWQAYVMRLAGQGGWHGFHISISHHTLEGVHAKHFKFPRNADHNDAEGIPDLLLVQPDRGILLMPELKRGRGGRLSPGQVAWNGWLSHVETFAAPVWRPSDEPEVRAALLGDQA